MHIDSILKYLLRETYLSHIARLLIRFIWRGMECILVFLNLGGGVFRTLCWGERRERKVRAAQNAGWRRRQIQARH